MSRSRRKQPYFKTLDGQQWWKRKAHRRRRRAWNMLRRVEVDVVLPHEFEFGDCWDWPSDGKWDIDVELQPELMRK